MLRGGAKPGISHIYKDSRWARYFGLGDLGWIWIPGWRWVWNLGTSLGLISTRRDVCGQHDGVVVWIVKVPAGDTSSGDYSTIPRRSAVHCIQEPTSSNVFSSWNLTNTLDGYSTNTLIFHQCSSYPLSPFVSFDGHLSSHPPPTKHPGSSRLQFCSRLHIYIPRRAQPIFPPVPLPSPSITYV